MDTEKGKNKPEIIYINGENTKAVSGRRGREKLYLKRLNTRKKEKRKGT